VRPSIAVLYFDNLSGDAELDWLRSGLTDMLVTDLSQSPDLRVLPTNRLYQILSDLEKLDQPTTSFETVQQVAERADAGTVIQGSFAKLGDTIRISYKIQAADTGEILTAQSVDANAQEELFSRVDDLSRQIRQSIELPARPVAVADRDLTEVSTSSVEAYRYFVEAEELHYQIREEEAIALYRKAVDLDPTFAMAWAKLATSHGNLARQAEAQEYAERAMEHLDRLTEPERAYVEGRYYGRTLETVGKAIKTYKETLTHYPHLTSLTNNLGILYGDLGLTDEAIAVLEQGVRFGDDFPGTYSTLAARYFDKGETERAYEVLHRYLSRQPQSFITHSDLAGLYQREGRLAEAEAARQKAEALRPDFPFWALQHYIEAVLSEDWQAAAEAVNRMKDVPWPFAKSLSIALLNQLEIYQGRLGDVPRRADEAIAAIATPGTVLANAYAGWAEALLALDQPQKALEFARRAREEGRGGEDDFTGHALEALAQQALGQQRRADLLAEELGDRVRQIPGPAWKGLAREVHGRLALMRGDAATAVSELELAEQALPPNDDDNVRIRFHLGNAYLAAGLPAEAQVRFERILASHADRVFRPLDYVRSHYLLGQIHEQGGQADRARQYYEKFLSYWSSGGFDPERVAHAQEFLKGA
jgi:tetratricopeptide (TPR) repeat protein